jgi:hypothetical protein
MENSKGSVLRLFVLCLFGLLLINVSIAGIVGVLERSSEMFTKGAEIDNFTDEVLLYFLLAPIFETLFFQLMPIWTLFHISHKKWRTILISATLFGLIHYYNVYYLIYGFLGGVILAFFFVETYIKKDWLTAYILTVLLHGMHNVGAFVLEYYTS